MVLQNFLDEVRLRIGSLGILLLGVWVVVSLGGCGDDKKPRPPTSGKTAQKKTGAAQVVTSDPGFAEVVERDEAYRYKAAGKRDPFRSEYKIVRKKKAKSKEEKSLLEQYEIGQLKLTAIIHGISTPRAQVELPDGRGVTIRKGTKIGTNKGKVWQIKQKEVIIREEFKDWVAKEKRINLVKMRLFEEPIR